MPNHRKLAREFTLFDNGYVSGTNSADGHAWSTQCLANDYLEHFYVGYSRTYPDDGDCAMSISNGGALWDAALKKGKIGPRLGRVLRRQARDRIDPKPEGLVRGLGGPGQGDAPVQVHRRHRRRQPQAATSTARSTTGRCSRATSSAPTSSSANTRSSAGEDTVPDLMIMSLPCDHGEGTEPEVSDAARDDGRQRPGAGPGGRGGLARARSGRRPASSSSRTTRQSGPDHVDGHRTVFMAISPYNRRGTVDSTFYTQTNMIRSIEMMLGLDPMNKFDASPTRWSLLHRHAST